MERRRDEKKARTSEGFRRSCFWRRNCDLCLGRVVEIIWGGALSFPPLFFPLHFQSSIHQETLKEPMRDATAPDPTAIMLLSKMGGVPQNMPVLHCTWLMENQAWKSKKLPCTLYWPELAKLKLQETVAESLTALS